MSNEDLLKVLEQKNRLLDINDELAEAIKEKNKEIYQLKKQLTEKAIKKAKGDE